MKKSYFIPKLFGFAFVAVIVAFSLVSYSAPSAQAALGLQFDSTNKLLAPTNTAFGSKFATTTLPGPQTYFFMGPGTGTTTLSLYTANTDKIALNILFAASSTVSTLQWRYEYSSNGLDWYSDDTALNTNATTTTEVQTFPQFSWTFASSTGGTATISTSFKHVTIPSVISPYTRIVFYMPVGSTPGAVNVQATLYTSNTI